MIPKTQIVFDQDNPKHLFALDRLVDWLLLGGQPESWSESCTVLPMQPILSPTLTAKDVKRALIRTDQKPNKVGLTAVGRSLCTFTNDVYTSRPFTEVGYLDPLIELQKTILLHPESEVEVFMAFYDAISEISPIPPLIRYIHSLLEPSYQAKELNHAS